MKILQIYNGLACTVLYHPARLPHTVPACNPERIVLSRCMGGTTIAPNDTLIG